MRADFLERAFFIFKYKDNPEDFTYYYTVRKTYSFIKTDKKENRGDLRVFNKTWDQIFAHFSAPLLVLCRFCFNYPRNYLPLGSLSVVPRSSLCSVDPRWLLPASNS